MNPATYHAFWAIIAANYSATEIAQLTTDARTAFTWCELGEPALAIDHLERRAGRH